MKRYLKRIVTHSGKAHLDDFLACCFALNDSSDVTVYRSEPDEKELEDPTVLVLDVGGRLEPKLNNFDHHQSLDLPCACWLYLQHHRPELHELFLEHAPWYTAMNILDCRGPAAWSKQYDCSDSPAVVSSPVQHAVIRAVFGDHLRIDSHSRDQELMKRIAQHLISQAKEMKDAAEQVEKLAYTINIEGYGLTGVVYPSKNPLGLNDWVKQHDKENCCPIHFSVTYDDRGEGLTIYRYEGAPIDLSRLEGHPEVVFAHKGGFVAKTKRQSVEVVKRLMCLARDPIDFS